MFDDENLIFKVVVNHEEQYSIWPKDKKLPIGWREEGTEGVKKVCLEHIGKVWTDMRPLSLRKSMDELLNQEK
ncbi:MAG: MbtH family NRPS accessory protein [Gammaproteobacteria bacterium]|nr:MbtH family NRPS accessory protein [Methylococcales bacterium]